MKAVPMVVMKVESKAVLMVALMVGRTAASRVSSTAVMKAALLVAWMEARKAA